MLGINWQSIMFHIFNFALLALLLNELLYKPINDFIENRENEYKEIEEETLNNLEKSKLLVAEHDKKMESIYLEAEEIKNKAIKEAQLQANSEIQHANEEKQRILEESRVQAQREKEILIRNAKADIREVAIEAAAKLSFTNCDVYDDFINHTKEEANE